MEDAEIVDLFFQRSEQAIPETAAKYQGLIFQISRNILENPQDAEECVNDTYLGLWNAIPPHRPNPPAGLCLPGCPECIPEPLPP